MSKDQSHHTKLIKTIVIFCSDAKPSKHTICSGYHMMCKNLSQSSSQQKSMLSVGWLAWEGSDLGYLMRFQSSDGLTYTGKSTSKVAPLHAWRFGVGCWLEASVLYSLESPQGCVSSSHTDIWLPS